MRLAPFCFAVAVTCLPACAPAPKTAPAPSAPAVYRSVHVDTLASDKVSQFETARREWLEELHRAHGSDGRGVFLQVGASRFFTLRSFARFADFDTRGEEIERSLSGVPKAAAERYDQGCDTALVYPHTSEIWRLEPDLSYTPASPLTERTAACGRFLQEDVRPDPASETRYQDATAAMHQALTAAHYPLTRLTFRTVYGAGHLVTLWLAHSREELQAAEPLPEVLGRVLGEARAKELAAACEASVVHREMEPLVVRQDLTQGSGMPVE